MILTIIIPVFNEEKTILQILKKIEKQIYVKKQIIIVDDLSTDSSRKKINKFKFKSSNNILFHTKNNGKGSCIKTAKKYIKGDFVIIQDADLEYDPNDYKFFVNCFKKKKYMAIYGSRVLKKKRYSNVNFTSNFRIFANHLLTIFSNIINKQQLTDAHTCYKAVNAKIFKKISLKENGFSFCPELTTKLSNLNIPIFEVPINYEGRSFEEGKKIKFSDGISAIITIVKYKFFNK
ncbi:glycosyltransferase family 2 protein [Pelagibacterales bacterium SAG-MED22]|nr:glycosyltransferase family 2 protein [Pelagibacterales bacterium SAG-MED22]